MFYFFEFWYKPFFLSDNRTDKTFVNQIRERGMIMKKYITIALAVFLCASDFCACKSDNGGNTEGNAENGFVSDTVSDAGGAVNDIVSDAGDMVKDTVSGAEGAVSDTVSAGENMVDDATGNNSSR